MKQTIHDTVVELHVSGNIEDLSDIEFSVNDQYLFELLKMKIRSETIAYSIKKKKEKRKVENSLEKDIYILETNLESLSKDDMAKLVDSKNELEKIRTEKMNGIIFRSKVKWYEEGEKSTEYFLNLEKRNYVNKNMTEIIDEANNKITDRKEILKATSSYYKRLYTSNHAENWEDHLDVFTNVETKLTDDMKETCEGSITFKECTESLNNMKNRKSPGSDGIPAEFYKFFWNDIGPLVWRSIKFAYDKGAFSTFQRQGIITCIPKEGRDRRYLKNWRPLSLLNVDFKIASGAIAHRVKQVLPNIISETQTGFLKNRFIGENTRILYDLMNHCEVHQIPGLLVTVDFEKAFDSIEWNFIDEALSAFNFGPSLRNWIKLFLRNGVSAVTNSGHMSDFFPLGRGCRQGDPLSPYLFIICAELLSIAIKRNKHIRGINVKGVEYCIFQYADDSNFTLDGSEKKSLRTHLGFKHICYLLRLKDKL